MPSKIRVVGQKFYAKLNNGDNFDLNLSDFSQHLKGGVLEEIKAVFTVQVEWYVHFGSQEATVYYDATENTLRITSRGTDFISNGFSVGDTYKYNDISWGYSGTVLSLANDEIILSVDSTTGSPDVGWSNPDGKTYLTGTTKKTALKYDFGLIENDEPINFLSKLTNTDQTYLFEGIDHNSPLTFVNGVSQGNNKAAYTGSTKVAFVKYVKDSDQINTDNTTQEFQIEHIFKINPVYRDGEIDSLKGTDTPPLDIFNGDASLKYVFQTEFRTTLNNPNTSMISSYDTQLGSVGYLDESYNGYASDFYTSVVLYTDDLGNPIDRLDVGKVTSVQGQITSRSLIFNAGSTPLIIGHTAILDSLKYSNSTDNYKDTWFDDSIRNIQGGGAVSSNIIKNFEITGNSTQIINFTFDVDLTSFSATNNLEENQDYLLYYVVGDPNKTVDQGSKVTGRFDVNFYSKNSDISGLFNVTKFEQYPHPYTFEQGVTTGFTNAKGFNETGYMLDCRFWVNSLDKPVLNNLKFDVVVYNTDDNTWVSLRSLDVDLSSAIDVNGIKQIELDSVRGYVLTDEDIFNSLKLTTDNNTGVEQFYNLQIGYKIPWQSWLEFKEAPTDFYDKNKSLNGLNQKTSNYSNVLGNYEIRVLLDADLDKSGITTQYVTTSEKFDIYDYDTDDVVPDGYTAEINTYNSAGTPIAGNVIKKDFTEVRAIFTPENPPVFTESVDFTEVSTVWTRFAHGNKYTKVDAFQTMRFGDWTNEQANDTDTFQNTDGSEVRNKLAADLYTSTTSQILADQNLGALYGCYSPTKYEFYDISGKMFSTSSDNDCLLYHIGFYVDENGVENTLSLVATTGGLSLDKNPSYVTGNDQTEIFFFNPPLQEANCNWGLVYNYGKDDWKLLDQTFTTKSGLGWSSVGDLSFTVKRSANDIEVDVDWTITGDNFNGTFNYNLNDNTETSKFMGFNSIGFGFFSQNQGGFKDVVLTKPTGDYYGILRMETLDAPTDFNINELSTEIEAPDNNLLTQITGDIKKSTLSYDGTNFIVQGLVDTSLFNDGEKYRFSAELRTKDLEE